MSIFRTTAGLLFRDQFTRANGALGASWNDISSARISVVGNQASHSSAQATDRAYATGTQASTCVVQASIGGGIGYAIVVARYNGTTGLGVMPPPSGSGSGDFYTFNVGANWTLQNTSSTGGGFLALTAAKASTQVVKLIDNDTVRKCWTNGVLIFDTAQAAAAAGAYARTGTSGTVGVGTFTGVLSGTRTFDDVCAYRGNTVVVTGLPNGYSARTASITQAGVAGTATVELGSFLCPAASVEVLNGASVVVATITPSDGVWGGDVYAYNTPPSAPTVTLEATDTFGEALTTVSAVVDPDSGQTHEVRVRVAPEGDEGDVLYDSGWVAYGDGEWTVEDLPLGVPLVAWALYRDTYEEGAESTRASLTLPSWMACGEPPDTSWTAC